MTEPGPYALIATMRNEAPWLLEWVAHHRATGFETLVIVSNDCTDGTDEMLDRLEALGVLRHIRSYPYYLPGNIKQAAYSRARVYPEIANAGWLITLDADEYLNVKIGDGTVAALTGALPPEAEAVPLARRLICAAPSGPARRLLAEPLTRAAAEAAPPNQIKILCRIHVQFPVLGRYGPILPRETPPDKGFDVVIVDAAGQPMPPRLMTDMKAPFTDVAPEHRAWDVAQINHYAALSPELYVLKRLKGDANQRKTDAPRKVSWKGYQARNPAAVTDRSILKIAPRRDAILAEYLADSVLAELDARAHADLERSVAAVRTDPDYAEAWRAVSRWRSRIGRLKGRFGLG